MELRGISSLAFARVELVAVEGRMDLPAWRKNRLQGIPCYFPDNSLVVSKEAVFMRVL